MNPLIQLKETTSVFLVTFGLACFAVSPAVEAVSPPPDGGYGGANTAEGTDALFHLTTGIWNSAFGFRALYNNQASIRNTALGYQALYNNSGTFNQDGQDNIAIGANALFSNTTGSDNVAIGSLALYHNVTGSNNIAIGDYALRDFTGSGATAVGDSFYSDANDLEVGRRRICNTDIVANATIHAYNIFIGDPPSVGGAPANCTAYPGTASVHIVVDDETNTGAVFVGGVYNNPISGSPVAIDASGKLGVMTSSKRFKTDIRSIDNESEAVLGLNPVTFRYNKDIDQACAPQFGLVAEDVEKVNPNLVVHDKDGKPYSVRYDAVNAMLLNEFLKEHHTVQEQGATIVRLQRQIEALTTGLQKVSAKLEVGESRAPTVVSEK